MVAADSATESIELPSLLALVIAQLEVSRLCPAGLRLVRCVDRAEANMPSGTIQAAELKIANVRGYPPGELVGERHLLGWLQRHIDVRQLTPEWPGLLMGIRAGRCACVSSAARARRARNAEAWSRRAVVAQTGSS